MISAGQRRHRMAFQAPATVTDTYGQQQTTWTTVVTLWVAILPLSSRELLAAAAVNAELTHEIWALWVPQLSDPKAVAAMRGVYNGRIYNLTAPINIEERNRWLQIPATEGVNNG